MRRAASYSIMVMSMQTAILRTSQASSDCSHLVSRQLCALLLAGFQELLQPHGPKGWFSQRKVRSTTFKQS